MNTNEASTQTKKYFTTTTAKVGTDAYYEQAMAARYYGVEDDGRSFTMVDA